MAGIAVPQTPVLREGRMMKDIMAGGDEVWRGDGKFDQREQAGVASNRATFIGIRRQTVSDAFDEESLPETYL